MTEHTFQRGDQVAYTPPHLAGNLYHPDAEFGFVMAPAGPGHYWCRFWRRGHLGELRTVANSEIAPADCLVAHDSVAPAVVDSAIDQIREAIATHLDMLADEENPRTVPRWYAG